MHPPSLPHPVCSSAARPNHSVLPSGAHAAVRPDHAVAGTLACCCCVWVCLLRGSFYPCCGRLSEQPSDSPLIVSATPSVCRRLLEYPGPGAQQHPHQPEAGAADRQRRAWHTPPPGAAPLLLMPCSGHAMRRAVRCCCCCHSCATLLMSRCAHAELNADGCAAHSWPQSRIGYPHPVPSQPFAGQHHQRNRRWPVGAPLGAAALSPHRQPPPAVAARGAGHRQQAEAAAAGAGRQRQQQCQRQRFNHPLPAALRGGGGSSVHFCFGSRAQRSGAAATYNCLRWRHARCPLVRRKCGRLWRG